MSKVRTRFAPSPTGRMHVGNLRTALYTYLIAKHEDGDFILRIEDTDQERFQEGAVDIIYRTLEKTGLVHDEGPDKDGGFGPYVQSERCKQGIYMKYAKQLIEQGEALPAPVQGRDPGQSGCRQAVCHPYQHAHRGNDNLPRCDLRRYHRKQ